MPETTATAPAESTATVPALLPALTPANDPTSEGTPVPRPPATAAPRPVQVRMPAFDDIFVHRVNQTIFHVSQVVTGAGGVIVQYTRFGDGQTYELSLPNFFQRLRPATEEEVTNMRRTAPVFAQQRIAANLERVNNLIQQLEEAQQPQAQQPGAEPQEGAEGELLPGENAPQIGLPPPPPGRRRNRGGLDGAPRDEQDAEVGEVIEPDPLINNFERLILYPEAATGIFSGLRSIAMREQMEARWQLSRISKRKGSVMLFFGPSGTGKTECALSVANHLGKKLYKVNYADIISKYYGDTAKHIVAIFKKAREHDAIPFLDEADSICSKRLGMDRDGATHVNQNRNTLMQQLDKYAEEVGDVPVILTTNLYTNFDSALVRRISRAVEFLLPDEGMRRRILDVQYPVQDAFAEGVSLDYVASITGGFSGGNLLTLTLNTIETASANGDDPAAWVITREIVDREVQAVRASILGNQGVTNAVQMVTPGNVPENGGFTIPA